MIYSKIIFPISQRLFWLKVKQRKKDWKKMIKDNSFRSVKTLDDINFVLYKEDVLSEVIYAGSFEWAEKEWVKSFLKPNFVFYDIGANIGFYTLIAAKIVGTNGKVYAIEPSLNTYKKLTENVSANSTICSQIETFQIAASDKAGENEIYVSNSDLHAWNSIAKPANASQFTLEKIKTQTIDELVVSNNWRPPDLIKIDVEGWEKFVLDGAKKIILKYAPALIIEFTKENLMRTETSYETVKNQLKEMGYDLYEYLPRYKSLQLVSNWDFEHKNIVAIHKK